jgi:hypothetical protein
MLRRRPALVPLFALALLGLTVTGARGTTFVLMDEQSLLESSHAVIVGTVTAIESAIPESDGSVYTYVHVQADRIIKGQLDRGPVVLREPGGSVGDRHEWIYGVPEFWVGERDLLFLARNPDGTLQTNSLAMGKYTLGVDANGHSTATRNLGTGASVLTVNTGSVQAAAPEAQRFLPLLSKLRTLARSASDTLPAPALTLIPPELATTPVEYHDSFTFLSNPPVRWFQPDSGQSVNYFVDSAGDNTLKFDASQAAVDAALAAWTNVATSNLVLHDAGTTAPIRLNDCTNSTSRVIFNDPFGEIPDPSGCGGVLAMGGYCATGNTTSVNGTQFFQIVTGRVTMNNGFGSCFVWTQCNVAEVLTHEIGHTLGLGHSSETSPEPNATLANATMYYFAHFDGRCASLRSDDIAGISFIYPGTPPPTATVTPSRTITPPPTVTPTRTPKPSATITPTTTSTQPPTATTTMTPTRTIAPLFSVSGQIRYAGSGVPVDGVTVSLEGPAPTSAPTDSTGQFTFANLPETTWRIVPQKLGGANNSISAADALAVLQTILGERSPTTAQVLACDVNGDGKLSAVDALMVLLYKVQEIASFPAAQHCGSDWVFVPQPTTVANVQVMPPGLGSGACQPGGIYWTPLASQAAGQDFTAALFGDCSGSWQPTASGPAGGPAGNLQRTVINDASAIRIGHALVERRRGSTPGSRLRVPVSIASSTNVRALDLTLRYDPKAMTPVGVRRTHGARHAMVAMHIIEPGVLALSLASSTPLQRGTVLMLQFEPQAGGTRATFDVTSAMVRVD